MTKNCRYSVNKAVSVFIFPIKILVATVGVPKHGPMYNHYFKNTDFVIRWRHTEDARLLKGVDLSIGEADLI